MKNLPAVRETQARSLGQEYPLEEGMTTHSGILAWRTSWTEESGGLQSMMSQRVEHNEQLTHTSCVPFKCCIIGKVWLIKNFKELW